MRAAGAGGDLIAVAAELWAWLAAEEHRGLLTLWVEGYARSLIDPDGPVGGVRRGHRRRLARVLGEVPPAPTPASPTPTLVLAVLRGALLDLLATGDRRAHRPTPSTGSSR